MQKYIIVKFLQKRDKDVKIFLKEKTNQNMYRIIDLDGIHFSSVPPGVRRKEEIPSKFWNTLFPT